jgi:hypothetical protein
MYIYVCVCTICSCVCMFVCIYVYICMYVYICIYFDEGECEVFRCKGCFTTGINVHICVVSIYMCLYVQYVHVIVCLSVYICIYLFKFMMGKAVRNSGVRAVLQQVRMCVFVYVYI